MTVVECASAVVRRDGSLLVVLRAGQPEQGLWAPPGGRRRPGESAGSAACRELGEETGLVGTAGAPMMVHDLTVGSLTMRITVVPVETPRRARPRAADDAAAVAWMPIAEASQWPLADGVDRIVALLLELG